VKESLEAVLPGVGACDARSRTRRVPCNRHDLRRLRHIGPGGRRASGGVQDAAFSYERGEGVVTYDPKRTSVGAIIAELTRMTGYTATAREGSTPYGKERR